MIDRELVTRKMVLIAEDLRRLEALAAKDREAYLASEIDETLAERYLERMIGALPVDFAARLAPCAGLRNRIVHAYDDLDPGRVYDALRAAMADVPAYLAAIRRFLEPSVP